MGNQELTDKNEHLQENYGYIKEKVTVLESNISQLHGEKNSLSKILKQEQDKFIISEQKNQSLYGEKEQLQLTYKKELTQVYQQIDRVKKEQKKTHNQLQEATQNNGSLN